MTAADRRRAILEVLSLDKFTTRANLAFEFGVSKRTIDHDLLLLSRKYPIYAIQGKDGGIHVMDNFRLDGRYLTEEQMDVLVRLTKEVSESDSCVLRSILKKFGKKKDGNRISALCKESCRADRAAGGTGIHGQDLFAHGTGARQSVGAGYVLASGFDARYEDGFLQCCFSKRGDEQRRDARNDRICPRVFHRRNVGKD